MNPENFSPSKKTVFVLGAGFTRAFIDKAVLLTDRYELGYLIKKYPKDQYPYAHEILDLESERQKANQGRLDIERLMTRLDGYMPHDYERRSTKELELLYRDIKRDFTDKLKDLIEAEPVPRDMHSFAEWCIQNSAHCITFNYDDFLDQALWRVEASLNEHVAHKYWHPNSGYGFFCRPAHTCVWTEPTFMGRSATLLLKLHGSINWRLKLGASRPCSIDSLVHFQKWFPPEYESLLPQYNREAIQDHLEPVSFIELPILLKTALTKEPIFRRVWSEAFKQLSAAEEVVFIGYSMPRTDIAAGFLLSEALRTQRNITVVNKADPTAKHDRDAIRTTYRSVFPQLADEQFHFDGAQKWIKDNLKP